MTPDFGITKMNLCYIGSRSSLLQVKESIVLTLQLGSSYDRRDSLCKTPLRRVLGN